MSKKIVVNADVVETSLHVMDNDEVVPKPHNMETTNEQQN